MTEKSNSVMELAGVLFGKVDEALSEWDWSARMQIPTLVNMVTVKMAWNEKQARKGDPIVRWYVSNHPAWHISPGAKGGIMKATEFQQKEAYKAAKDAAKQEMEAKISAVTSNDVSKEDDNA